MPWYLYLALRQLFPKGRFVSFFTLISMISVALGVALMIVVLGVMGGFGWEVRRMMVDTQGEVQVRSQAPIMSPKPVIEAIQKVPGVKACTPFAEGMVNLVCDNKPVYPLIQGVDLSRVESVVNLRKNIRVGSLDDLDDDSLILSWQLANSVGATLGSRVQIYTPLMMEKLKRDEYLLPRTYRVVGIFEIGHQQLDSSLVICTLRTMQDLYGLGRAVHGINVKLNPGEDADAMATRITTALAGDFGLVAKSWFEINEQFMWVLQFEKNMMTFILLFVVLVAAFLTMSLLLVLVLKKTREIGLLGALGAGRREIAASFCLQGVLIGLVGSAVGLGGGLLLLHYRNDLLLVINRFGGSREMLSRFYQFSQMPAHLETSDVVIIMVSALLLSTLAGLVPALMAARMKPAEALRAE